MVDFKVSRSTVRDQAIDSIKEAILSGFIQPGQRLIEKNLCEMCDVSRTSIREALRVLEGEKLIVNLPHKGPRVAIPTLAEAHQIYEVRALLEGLLGRYATMRATSNDIKALHQSVDAFERAQKSKDLRRMVFTADEFFMILSTTADCQIVSDLLKSLRARISTLRATSMSSPGRGPHSTKEMRDIVVAMERGDPEATTNACVRHVHEAAKAAQLQLTGHTETAPVNKKRPGPAARNGAKAKK